MRYLKIAAYVAGALVAVVVVAMILVLILVNPNNYKDDIARLVRDRTGRQLTLSGDLKLSVFPWLAIEMGPAQLAERQGFGNEPFVALKHARLGVRLLPLF